MRVAQAPEMPGTFTRHPLQRKPLFNDPGMHHGTCATRVSWCLSGSLTRGGGENVPGFPGACAICNFAYLVRGPWCNGVITGLSGTLLYYVLLLGIIFRVCSMVRAISFASLNICLNNPLLQICIHVGRYLIYWKQYVYLLSNDLLIWSQDQLLMQKKHWNCDCLFRLWFVDLKFHWDYFSYKNHNQKINSFLIRGLPEVADIIMRCWLCREWIYQSITRHSHLAGNLYVHTHYKAYVR